MNNITEWQIPSADLIGREWVCPELYLLPSVKFKLLKFTQLSHRKFAYLPQDYPSLTPLTMANKFCTHRENWQFQEGNFSRSCIQLAAIFGSYCLYFLFFFFFYKFQLFILGSTMFHSFDDEKTRVDPILMSHNASRFAWTLYNIKWFIKIWPIKIQL